MFTDTLKHSLNTGDPKNDPRLAHRWQSIRTNELPPAEQPSFVALGYNDDEGIRLNGGRLGAAQAPDEIRKQLLRMTPKNKYSISDLGNLEHSKETPSIKSRHQLSEETLISVYAKGLRTLSFGGGHDYAYPDTSAFLESFKESKQKPLIINFDAHLDVRDLSKGISSGTPFYRLLENHKNFDFIEVGIQKHCNSEEHIQYCNENAVPIIYMDELLYQGISLKSLLVQRIPKILERPRPTFLSIDIDAFSSSFAMGCSQAWPSGFTPEQFFPAYRLLLDRLNVMGVGIYEVSPPLDMDSRTSKLAAELAFQYLEATAAKMTEQN